MASDARNPLNAGVADRLLEVAVETPQHSGLGAPLTYRHGQALPAGTLVRVPLGRRELAGIVWTAGAEPGAGVAAADIKPLKEVLSDLPPLPPDWLALCSFAAAYYQRGVGELALAVLPPELRKLDAAALARRLRRLPARLKRMAATAAAQAALPQAPPEPTDEQRQALAAIEAEAGQPAPRTMLLHGVTGSGKTEVYLRATAAALARGGRALVLVPEINLTPQLESRFAARFPGRVLVSLHSGLTPAQRIDHWLAAHLGLADIVLGTRLAIFASLPGLALIVVDEEHDPSYKQQDSARYSARDLAVWRGHRERIPVLLGSATPSLETWAHAQQGRYRRLALDQRIAGARLPTVRVADLGRLPRVQGQPPPLFAPAVLAALQLRLARGEQSIVFLNRRGYAPVLHCPDCGWKSECPHCSAWRVFHKGERALRCHHCGLVERVPRACPTCGNLDIQPIGRGTEKLEEQIAELLPTARLARIDADTARGVGALGEALAQVHDGEVDILVGTQMVTKGHDFRRVTLVVAVNPDSALFASDFRAPERLFALLMQAAGRAGRAPAADGAEPAPAEMWLQTWHPQHGLYRALAAHDYASFAQAQLAERRSAGLPPYAHLALLRAEARDGAVAEAFLQAAAQAAAGEDAIALYPPVPPTLARVAGFERRQMLLESRSRSALQQALAALLPQLHVLRRQHKGLARWAVDVDPQAI
ncbi:MAG: primosomal protein N' [Aquabacterium sp.]